MTFKCEDCKTTDPVQKIERTLDPIRLKHGDRIKVTLCYSCWIDRYDKDIWKDTEDDYTI